MHKLKANFLFCSAETDPPFQDEETVTLIVPDDEVVDEKPPMYKVLLLNDDYTPMEFVVAVLQRVFSFTPERAFDLMLTVHNEGVGVVGVFAHEIAETKSNQVLKLAQEHGHPLLCTIEEE